MRAWPHETMRKLSEEIRPIQQSPQLSGLSKPVASTASLSEMRRPDAAQINDVSCVLRGSGCLGPTKPELER
jgi:hypothetical protein